MMDMTFAQQELVAAFAPLQEDRELLFAHIIAWGSSMHRHQLAERVAAYQVPGCLAKVWIASTYKQQRLFLQGDSNAAITKGLLALLLHIFSGQPPTDIIHRPLFCFTAIGLDQIVSPQRRGGLDQMIGHIRQLAREHSASCQQSQHDNKATPSKQQPYQRRLP